jgi:hypothetical protein
MIGRNRLFDGALPERHNDLGLALVGRAAEKVM